MTEQKFTPGPWKAVQHGEGIYTWTIRGNDEFKDRSLAIVGVGTPNLPRDEANMHLIAAAPDMYNFLFFFETILGQQLLARLGQEGKAIFDEIEKILRKARGESDVKND